MMTPNNSSSTRSINRLRKGGTLISVIAVMLIMGVLGVSVISMTHTSEHSSISANAGSRAYYLAESGLRYAQQIYCDEGWLHGRERTLTLLGGEQVDIIRIGGTFWATAVVDAGTAKEARASVPMPLSLCGADPAPVSFDDFAIFGDTAISLGNNMIVKGNVAIIEDNVAIKGDVDGNILAQDVEFTAHGVVTGDIYASGSVDSKVGEVTGDIHAAGGIRLRSTNATVFEGWVFSIAGPIVLEGQSQIRGHVHACAGDITLGGSANVGTASDPIEIRASGDVSISGSAKIYGNVYAGGSITGAGAIYGDAYAGGTISGSPHGESLPNNPNQVKEAICPDLSTLEDLSLPDATVYTAGGSDVSIGGGRSQVLSPGTYGDLSSPNNSQGTTHLYLSAGSSDHGNYYFDSIDLGKDMTIHLDLSGTYDIRIFVVGNISVGSDLNVYVSLDGSTYNLVDTATDPLIGARLYWETHGDFSVGSGLWFGSVYSTTGSLSAGNSSHLIGSFFSGGGHSFQGSSIVHVAPNYFTND